jgi:hypothetical protein
MPGDPKRKRFLAAASPHIRHPDRIASGDIAPSAAMQIARLIDVHLRAISTNDLEARMARLEKDRANSAAQDVARGEIFR